MIYVFVALSGAMVDFSAVQNIEAQMMVVGAITIKVLLIHSLVIFLFGRLITKDIALISIASVTNISGANFSVVFCQNTGRDQYMLPSILLAVLGTGLGSYVGFVVVEILNSL